MQKMCRSVGNRLLTRRRFGAVFYRHICNNRRHEIDRPVLVEDGKAGSNIPSPVFVKRRSSPVLIAIASALGISLPLTAAILPEDRVDTLYHRYQGGGVTIEGPSILARKQIGKHVSISGNIYEDSVTSASIDVVTQGSPYKEHRKEKRVGMDFLNENTTMNLTYVNSEENDYVADTYSFSVSHDMFGELTTVTLGYTRGDDYVSRNDVSKISGVGPADHYKYRLDLSQILTKDFVIGMGMELITDEGKRADVTDANAPQSTLNNPYRRILTEETDADGGYNWFSPEKYPQTRTSNAYALRGKYYLPYRASIGFEYRNFVDTWDIRAKMVEVKYVQPIMSDWLFDFSYRTYSQTQASFYSDTFLDSDVREFKARDKELSTFTSNSLGLGASYEFGKKGWWIFKKGSVNLSYHRINFDYENFTDRSGVKINSYIPYSFTADVYTFFLSGWY